MRKATLLLFLFFSASLMGQINATGDAHYKLDILAYMGRGNDGCGNIDGLRYIKAIRFDGSSFFIYNDRKIYQPVDHTVQYTKNDKIKTIEIKKIIRWKNGLGNCDGGPDDRFNIINIANTCFSTFIQNAGDGLNSLTVTSKPYVKINTSATPLYLGDQDILNISLPDNIDGSYLNWKFKVGTGPEQTIPIPFNNTNILNIAASDFLAPADFGKTVSVWVEMNCNAGTELAKGYARRDAYYTYTNCTRECIRGPISSWSSCLRDCRDTFDTEMNTINTNPPQNLVTQYQSLVSNALSFTYLMSAPKVESYFSNDVTCFDSNDGKISIKFDRPLQPNENLTISLIKDNVPTSFYNVVLDGNNTYTADMLFPGNYQIQVSGSINGTATYSSTIQNPLIAIISKPDPVDFTLSKVDVWCNGGNDGSITIQATGGNLLDATGNGIRYYYSVNDVNWLPFSTENQHTITGLFPGTYTIKVRDYKECYAKTPQGQDKVLTVVINQPSSPVSLMYTEVKQPTFYGGTNGRIVAAVQGGTRFADNSYNYEWINSTGILQTSITTFYDAGSSIYYITLDGISSDTYTLTVKDKNFNNATNQTGCTVSNSTQFLGQPDPIVVTLQILQTISCNATNTFGNETDFNPADGQRDESQDGIIHANVTGGVPFTGFENNGLSYKFYWKKQLLNGTWVDWNNADATAENLSHGNYSLNVEDKNGIKLGLYTNNLLTQETPVEQFMQQPDKLELAFQNGDISCNSGNDGWVKAIASGGTLPYTYEWTTGDTSDQITNLIANNYFVKVTDAKGCITQGSVTIQQPNGIEIIETTTNPTCNNGNDGNILISIVGGTQPYTYSWSSGQTTKDIYNLESGNYRLTLIDAKGCTYFKDIILENPDSIILDLGEDRTLCNGQTLDLDININDPAAQYYWTSTNGFTATTSAVSLTNPGTYQAKIISSKGCEVQDEVNIVTSNVSIASEFFLTSQAYLDEDVILVNASNPLGQNTVWEIPANVTIVTQTERYIVLRFSTVGSYTITLKQTQGDCYALYSKVINVEAKSIDSNIGYNVNPFITEFLVTPNPSNGDFNAIVKLEEISPINLRLYALNGQQPLIQVSDSGQKSYLVNFNTQLPSGTYALILETSKQTLVKKIIIY